MNPPQPKNSATHAIESLSEYLQHGPPGVVPLLDERVEEAIVWLKKSVKFLGPPNGQFLERVDMLAENVDYPHLPFDAICLEYDYDIHNFDAISGIALADPTDQPDRVCVLAFYPDPNTLSGRLVKECYGELAGGEFIVWPITGYKSGRTVHGDLLDKEHWIPAEPVLVTRERRGPLSVEIRMDGIKRVAIHWLADERTLAMHLAGQAHVGETVDLDKAVQGIAINTGPEATAIVELCNLLECTNVSAERIVAPERLNRKREAKGKLPFFEYRVLTIRDSGERLIASPGGTEHTSPRFHLRRGHIRRLAGERKTWVRPHTVGEASRGVVVKDYDLPRK